MSLFWSYLDLYFMINCVAGIYFYPAKQLDRASELSSTMVMNNRQARFLNVSF